MPGVHHAPQHTFTLGATIDFSLLHAILGEKIGAVSIKVPPQPYDKEAISPPDSGCIQIDCLSLSGQKAHPPARCVTLSRCAGCSNDGSEREC